MLTSNFDRIHNEILMERDYSIPSAPKSYIQRFTVKEGRDLVSKNIRSLEDWVTTKVIYTIGQIVINLLANTLPRTPVDSGQLRESGQAIVKYRGGKEIAEIGKGQKDGTVKANMSTLRIKGSQRYKMSGNVGGEVRFYRINEKGEDIALWCHEDLLPAGSSGHPRAIIPGTGPKYLVLAFQKMKPTYINLIQRAVDKKTIENEVKKMLKVIRPRKQKFEVDLVELVLQKGLANLQREMII